MEVTAQRIVLGLADGAVYGLFALGLVITYRAGRILNFAAAGFGAVGAYLLHDAMDASGGGAVRYVAVFAAGVAIAAGLGVVTERFVLWPLRRAPAGAGGEAAGVAATATVLLGLLAAVTLRYGPGAVTIESPIPREPYPVGRHLGVEGLGEVVITRGGALTLAVLVLVGIAAGLAHLGARRRRRSGPLAGAGTPPPAERTTPVAWAAGSALAAAAAMLFATTTLASPLVLAVVGLKALMVAVFARLSDVRLCLVGGPALGVIEALAGTSGVAGLDQAIGFFALLAVLLARSRTMVVDARA